MTADDLNNDPQTPEQTAHLLTDPAVMTRLQHVKIGSALLLFVAIRYGLGKLASLYPILPDDYAQYILWGAALAVLFGIDLVSDRLPFLSMLFRPLEILGLVNRNFAMVGYFIYNFLLFFMFLLMLGSVLPMFIIVYLKLGGFSASAPVQWMVGAVAFLLVRLVMAGLARVAIWQSRKIAARWESRVAVAGDSVPR